MSSASRISRARKAATAGPRKLAADPVFDSLAGAILRGKFPPGSPLPPERELAALFNVSRLIARQALHRLREIGLVRGGQGGQTMVLDPDASNDPRIVALTIQLAPERTDEQDVIERQILGGVMLLQLAELRIDAAGLDALSRLVAEAIRTRGAEELSEEHIGEFETEFWTMLASVSKNRILLREARWWFDMLRDQPERRRRMYARPELRLALYQNLVDRLRRRDEVVSFYLTAVRSLLARPGEGPG